MKNETYTIDKDHQAEKNKLGQTLKLFLKMEIFNLKIEKFMLQASTSQPTSQQLFREVNMRNCLSGFGHYTKMWFRTIISYMAVCRMVA